jgi:hypothetical protein
MIFSLRKRRMERQVAINVKNSSKLTWRYLGKEQNRQEYANLCLSNIMMQDYRYHTSAKYTALHILNG